MNKKILFAAVGAALAVAPMISAQADVKIGGLAHLSLDSLDRGVSGDTGSLFLSNNSSNISIGVSEDLGGGMKAIAKYEFLYEMDSNQAVPGSKAGRDTYVGLQGGFGTVLLGHMDDPVKQVGRKVDLFYNEQLGESRAIVAQTNFDARLQNSIRYNSNNMDGFSFAVHYSVAPGAAENFTNDWTAMVLGLNYKAGPLYVGVAHKSLDLSATTDTSAIRVGATYDMGAFKFAGFYQSVSNVGGVTTSDQDTIGLGVAFKAGNNTFKAQWYQADETASGANNGGTQTSFGVDHSLSKNTIVYATYAKTSNDSSTTTYGIGGSGHGASAAPTTNGGDASGMSFGMRMKF